MNEDKYGQNRPLDVLNTRGLTAKREYVRSLEQRRDAEAISLLVECLCDESSYLRELAEEAFLHMGEEQAGVLVPLLSQGLWFTRVSAARVLGRLGFRPAAPVLLGLGDDANASVRGASTDALVVLGHQRGSLRIAHALHRLPPDVRRRRLDEITRKDGPLGDRLERLMRNEELMGLDSADAVSDDSPVVRASEESVEWELLTGPPPPKARPNSAPDGNAGTPGS